MRVIVLIVVAVAAVSLLFAAVGAPWWVGGIAGGVIAGLIAARLE